MNLYDVPIMSTETAVVSSYFPGIRCRRIKLLLALL